MNTTQRMCERVWVCLCMSVCECMLANEYVLYEYEYKYEHEFFFANAKRTLVSNAPLPSPFLFSPLIYIHHASPSISSS